MPRSISNSNSSLNLPISSSPHSPPSSTDQNTHDIALSTLPSIPTTNDSSVPQINNSLKKEESQINDNIELLKNPEISNLSNSSSSSPNLPISSSPLSKPSSTDQSTHDIALSTLPSIPTTNDSPLPPINIFLKKEEVQTDDNTKLLQNSQCFNKTRTHTCLDLLDNSKNIDPNTKDVASGNTPLHYASILLNSKVVKKLIEKGANVNAKNNDNMTPLLNIFQNITIRGNDNELSETFQILIENGALQVLTEKDGKKILEQIIQFDALDLFKISHKYAKEFCIEIAKDTAKSTIKAYLEINAPDEQGNTLLHIACRNNRQEPSLKKRLDKIQELITAGADVSAKNKKNTTPLLYAIQGKIETWFPINGKMPPCEDNPEIIKILIKHGALKDLTKQDTEDLLAIAIERGQLETVKILVESLKQKKSIQEQENLIGYCYNMASIHIQNEITGYLRPLLPKETAAPIQKKITSIEKEPSFSKQQKVIKSKLNPLEKQPTLSPQKKVTKTELNSKAKMNFLDKLLNFIKKFFSKIGNFFKTKLSLR